jgi:hypothetical protein
MKVRGAAYRVLVGRQEGKTALGRPRCRWEYNFKMYIHGRGGEQRGQD